jgi:hypothetical protein
MPGSAPITTPISAAARARRLRLILRAAMARPTTPYIINAPIHLYNLAWLQYLGYFNQVDSSNVYQQKTYFVLGADVDMASDNGANNWTSAADRHHHQSVHRQFRWRQRLHHLQFDRR